MKSLIQFLALSFFSICTIGAQVPFITTWKTDNLGTSCNSCITIPTSGGGYNYEVDWDNDGVYEQQGVTGDVSHDFVTPGTYTIKIRGAFPRIRFHGQGDKDKIINIGQWGDISWSSMDRAFMGCSHLNSDATDAPDLSNVTSMAFMFYEATTFNADIGHWDVSNVMNFSFLFYRATAFNENINNWDVAKAQYLNSIFFEATSYNQPMDKWNVTNVMDVSDMFRGATTFNQDIGGWNTENMAYMEKMFQNATNFNQDISSWNTSSAEDMFFMFASSGLDQSLSNWNIENVTEMKGLFNSSAMSVENYDQTIIGWSQQNVQPDIEVGAFGKFYCISESQRETLMTNHRWTFTDDSKACTSFKATFKTDNHGTSCDKCVTIPIFGSIAFYDVDWESDGTFDEFGLTSESSHEYDQPGAYQVTIRGDLRYLRFFGSGEHNKILSIDQWGGSEWTSFQVSFSGCENLQILASDAPDLSTVTSMAGMFREATVVNTDISHWDVSNIENMLGMFDRAISFDQDLSNWNISSATEMQGMFDLSGMSISNYDKTLNSWAYQNPPMDVSFGSGLEYCNSDVAHDILTTNFNWIFEDEIGKINNNFIKTNGGDWHDDSLWSQLTAPRTCNDVTLDMGGLINIEGGAEGFGATLQVDTGTSLEVHKGGALVITN